MDLNLWKSKRKELNLRYEDLAKAAGVSKRTIEDIFRGYTSNPRIDTVEAIERALGITEKSPAAQDAQPSYVDAFVRDFGDLFADEDFIKYARLYKIMDAAQRIYLLGVIVGHLERAGVTIPFTLR